MSYLGLTRHRHSRSLVPVPAARDSVREDRQQCVHSWRVLISLWMGVVWLLATDAVSVDAADKPRRLNVVFMLADDLGWGDVGCYGQQKIPTPHLDKLAQQGLRFTQHYSGAPVCAPSRCVLMTGLHLGHAEIRGNRQAHKSFPEFTEGQHPIRPDAKTIAEVFQAAGYATGAFGKWGLGPVGSTGEPNAQGFDAFFGYNCQAVAHSYFPKSLWRNREAVIINPTRSIPGHQQQPDGPVNLDDWQGETYAPRAMLDAAKSFLRGVKDQPFFLYLPFVEPHLAMQPPAEQVSKFPMEWDTEAYRGEAGYLPHPRPRAAYAAMVHDLDAHVGEVLAMLDELQLADDTLVIFSSDNGATMPSPKSTRFYTGGVDGAFFHSTADLRGYKGSVYEGGLRVPCLARLPGRIPAGQVTEFPSYFADWFPTLCAAAGLSAPERTDGTNLWPMMTGQAVPEHRRPMVWVFPESGGQVAVRQGDFKLVRQRLNTKQPGPWEVYDVARDLSEAHDVAADHAALIANVEALLRREVDDNPVFPVSIPNVTPQR
jgi:arylsulfatase A